jgi:energy-coupling factor transport system ATP-binding protein
MIISENLCYEYTRPEDTPADADTAAALFSVSIRVQKGEFVAVLGRNGSGKSTLARHMNALLTPTRGTIWVKGLDTRPPENTWPIRQSAGMVFQNPDSQLIATMVEEDVAFGPENLGVPAPEIRRRVDRQLSAVGMGEYAQSAPQYLSGGQKQRVAIAGVLAMEPDCLVLDEPTAMLDPSGRREILETVQKLNRENGITVILITHYMEEAALADRVIVMDRGAVALDGIPREVFRRVDEMKALGLDVPPMAALTHALAGMGISMPETPMTVAEFMQTEFIGKLISGIAQ